MNVMHQVEQAITEGTRIAEEVEAERRHAEPIAKLLQRIDDTDLIKAHNHYAQLLDQSSEEILSRMRHRATMLRERANQLDHEADEFTKKHESISRRNFGIMEDIEEIENILRSLAHIEPQRV